MRSHRKVLAAKVLEGGDLQRQTGKPGQRAREKGNGVLPGAELRPEAAPTKQVITKL